MLTISGALVWCGAPRQQLALTGLFGLTRPFFRETFPLGTLLVNVQSAPSSSASFRWRPVRWTLAGSRPGRAHLFHESASSVVHHLFLVQSCKPLNLARGTAKAFRGSHLRLSLAIVSSCGPGLATCWQRVSRHEKGTDSKVHTTLFCLRFFIGRKRPLAPPLLYEASCSRRAKSLAVATVLRVSRWFWPNPAASHAKILRLSMDCPIII